MLEIFPNGNCESQNQTQGLLNQPTQQPDDVKFNCRFDRQPTSTLIGLVVFRQPDGQTLRLADWLTGWPKGLTFQPLRLNPMAWQ